MSDPQERLDGAARDDADLALLGRSAAGDRAAFDRFVARHQASVFRFARTLVPRPQDAEDVMQQTFLAAWRGAGGFRGEASARTWVLTIARHAAHHLRGAWAREPVSDTPIDELGVRAGWGGDDPEALALAAERREHLAAAFAAMSPAEREVLTLRDLEGLSGEDTAALLGLSLAAMKSRLHRARMTLAAHVTEVSGATRRT